jgi:hypothetical protein
MSRVVEFRRRGWSDRAAVCLALERTGSIITCAGVIMAVSFAGLFVPATLVLNQVRPCESLRPALERIKWFPLVALANLALMVDILASCFSSSLVFSLFPPCSLVSPSSSA